ncbi:MAG: secretin N-terminal domain-containing protein [Pyrinomonadaceae bacterium]
MKKSIYFRFSLSFILMLALFSPTAVLAMGDGKKHFNQGMKHEVAEEWDKAAEEFALAVSDNPKNPEYRLHYIRSLFNASQMFMKKGRMQADEKDYAGAYISFRKAYAYDPVNELAKSEMERMLRFQQSLTNGSGTTTQINGVKLVETGYTKTANRDDIVVPQRLEVLRDVGPYPAGIKLMTIIRDLARSLDLNVLFDTESRLETRDLKIELKDVTAAKALDYVFMQENLFFQKVGPRTILVAIGNRRQNFQQLVLRTFYLANANPKDVAKVVQTAIPAQPGRTPTIPLIDEATNSITVRDTSENIKIIANLITSLDKDRAEVVMDVAIYEVSKSDLLQLGNQIGNGSSLRNLGGATSGVVSANNSKNTFRDVAGALIPQTLGVGLIVPAVNLIAFQSKDDTKLLASTQIHAFNNEDSSARIGQRVPVQTASFVTGGATNPGGNGVVSNVVNYEQVGLTLKFKPIVFPNQDVQVAMEIESKDVVAGGTFENPVFSERTIKGTARVQNNKTLLLASVAQNVQQDGRQGLPLLGLIPILGRLFTAPTKNNRQVDIVIAITPRVIRAPAILPEDEAERPTGSLAVLTSGLLEAMIIQEEREEQLALARRLPTVANVQLPDQKVEEQPTYIKSDSANTESSKTENVSKNKTENTTAEVLTAPNQTTKPKTETSPSLIKPIDTSVKALNLTQTSSSPNQKIETNQKTLPIENEDTTEPKTESSVKPTASLRILPTLSEMKRGEKTKLAVMVQSGSAFRSAVLGLKFDSGKVAVRSVGYGDVFGKELANTPLTPFLNQNGKMFVSLSTDKDVAQNSSGILAYIEIEALTDGKPEIAFDADILNFLTADGKVFSVKY